MPRLSAIPGLVSSALVAATAVWWLASVALQLGSGFADVTELSTHAAAMVILAQWILIALFVAPACAVFDTQPPRVHANLLAMTLPLWPLLALLWLTSKLSVITLIVSQLGALSLAVAMLLFGRAIASKKLNAELRQLLSVTAGIAVAAMIWLARTPLFSWLSS